MAKYAKYTKVPVNKSKRQIEDLLKSWGVEEYFFGTSPRGEGIGFKYNGSVYKFNVPTPDPNDFSYQTDYERAIRQRWRILFMSLKMDLEKIEDGMITFEDQFLAQRVLPDGSTVADFIKLPENVSLLQQAKMPLMLTGE